MKISQSVGTIAGAVALIFLLAASVSPRADGSLVGLWYLDEESGPTVFDSSGNANDGTIDGDTPAFVPGLFGNALAFSPGLDYVEIPGSTSLNVSASYTFEAWVHLPPWLADCAHDAWQGLFRRGAAGSSSSQLEIYVLPCGGLPWQQGKLAVVHNRVSGFPSDYVYFEPVPRDTWVHVAVRWNGSGMPEAFYDGVYQAPTRWWDTSFANPAANTPPKPNYIGLGYDQDDMRGMLDEVCLWNRALTDDEILSDASTLPVDIDIKPGSADNPVNLRSNGVVPVAILTTDEFDASTVNRSSLSLAGAAAVAKGKSGNIGAFEDVDGDGDLDLVVQFPVNQLQLTAGATRAVLTGFDVNGLPLRGSDTIRIVPR